MAYYTLRSLDGDPNLATSLGNMVVAWAWAEEIVMSTFARVAGINLNLAMAGFARIPTFESRVKFVRALIGEWQTTKYDKDKIDHQIYKLGKLASARNHWVHGDWCKDDKTGEIVIFDHRADLASERRCRPVKAADVRNHIAAVKQHTADLFQLIDRSSIPA